MSATTISVALQKGGVGKTTSTGVTSYLLAKEGYKVLAIDFDSQGNLTKLLTQRKSDTFENTILEAMYEQDAKKYVIPIMENLDLIPANDYLATFPRWLYTKYHGNPIYCLDETLKNVQEDYDFIVIDCPPALSDQTINALCTSNYVIIAFETSDYSYDAIPRLLATIQYAQGKVKEKRNLEIAGILCNLIDVRRTETNHYLTMIDNNYPHIYRFQNVVKRLAPTSRLSVMGWDEGENKELKRAIEPYKEYIKELLQRVKPDY